MERIVLEVDDSIANAYQNFSIEAKQKFNLVINLFMKKVINDAGNSEYQKILNNKGNKAEKNAPIQDIVMEAIYPYEMSHLTLSKDWDSKEDNHWDNY